MNRSIQIQRLEKQIHKLMLRTLVEDVNDPELQLVSFTFVKLSNDKSWLTVYVDHFNRSQAKDVLVKLNKVSGLFRSVLAKNLKTYKVPEIRFVDDYVLDEAAKIEKLIKENLKSE